MGMRTTFHKLLMENKEIVILVNVKSMFTQQKHAARHNEEVNFQFQLFPHSNDFLSLFTTEHFNNSNIE
jgi:hypothetical protein